MTRFGDIDISFKRLPPVYGYHSQKLVSLEKALELIQPEINELPRYIKIAKRYSYFPSKHDLTQDESASIYIYTMEWGDETVYRISHKALKIWLPYLKLFDTALDKLSTVKEIIWSGISLDIGKDFLENQMITWWGVNSCSSSANAVKNFIGNDKKSTLFLIEAINGKRVFGYTKYENEDEIILKMGTLFRVKADSSDYPNGSHVVHLIEIGDNNDDKTLAFAVNEIQTTSKPSN